MLHVVRLIADEVRVVAQYPVVRLRVAEEKRVVDDNDVRRLRRLARLEEVTAVSHRALLPQTGAALRRDPAPQVPALPEGGVLSYVAGVRLLLPQGDGEQLGALARREPLVEHLPPPRLADVVPSPLQERCGEVHVQHSLEERNVPEKELLLKILRVGGNDDTLAV